MPDESIPGGDHVARHCTRTDFVDEKMTQLFRHAFEPIGDDPDISVNWLEFYNADFDTRIDAVCRDMSSEREVRRNHKLALLEVNDVREIGTERGHNVDVVPDAVPGNDSHALIIGVPLNETIVYQELADAASLNLVGAIAYKKKS